MAHYHPLRAREVLATVHELDEHVVPSPPTRDPPPPPIPPAAHREPRPAAYWENLLSLSPPPRQSNRVTPPIPHLPVFADAKSSLDWSDDEDGSSKRKKKKNKKQEKSNKPDQDVSESRSSPIYISNLFKPKDTEAAERKRQLDVDIARAAVQESRSATEQKIKDLENDGWRRSLIQQTLYGALDDQKSPQPSRTVSQEEESRTSSRTISSNSMSTPLDLTRTRTTSESSVEGSKILRAVKSLKNLRSSPLTPASTPRDSESSYVAPGSPEEPQVTMRDLLTEPVEDVPPVPAIPKQYRTGKLRKYFSNINLRSKAATEASTPSPVTNASTTSLNPPVESVTPKAVVRRSPIESGQVQTPNRHGQEHREPVLPPVFRGPMGIPVSPILVKTPKSKSKNKSPLVSSPSVPNMLSPKSPSRLPRSTSGPSLPAMSPARLKGRKLRTKTSQQSVESDASSATITSPTMPMRTPTKQKVASPLRGDGLDASVITPSSANPSVEVAGTTPEWWEDTLRTARKRMLKDVAKEHISGRDDSSPASPTAEKAARRLSSAQRLTAGLIERCQERGITSLKNIEEMTEEDFDFIAEHCNRGAMGPVRDFLLQPTVPQAPPEATYTGKGKQAVRGEPVAYGLGIDDGSKHPAPTAASSIYSDADSILSTISANRIERALGPDFNPHLSTFGVEAVQYLDELKKLEETFPNKDEPAEEATTISPALGAPGKLRMTPELQQELVSARAAREERLKSMPRHPCLRGGPAEATSGGGVVVTTRITAVSDDSSSAPRRGERNASPHSKVLLRAGDRDTSRSSGPGLGLTGNSVLQDWEQSSPPSVAAGETLARGLSTELQVLRQEFGLGVLRGRRLAAQKHPRHSFSWQSKKLMCRGIHNPVEMLPAMPAVVAGKAVNMKNFGQKFFETANTAAYKAPEKCGTERCKEYCCHYGGLISAAVPGSNDVFEVSQSIKHMEEAMRLRNRVPMGTDAWENFLQCIYCKKQCCPTCTMLCGQPECKQAFCSTCRDSSFCEDHEQ